MSLSVFWRPEGFTLDTIRQKRFIKTVDGDSIDIRMPIRMLSIDTPEKSVTKTSSGLRRVDMETLMDPLADWIESGESPVVPALANHLLPRLRRPNAAQAQWDAGAAATAAHDAIVERRLTRPTGSKRAMFVRVADERFEKFGRLLAYLAPSYTSDELATMTRRERATFNFSFLASGWAASFIIYPSVPGERDLPMVQAEAKAAIDEGRGQWADPLALAGYEYRMVEGLTVLFKKVHAGNRVSDSDRTGWISRYCADIETGLLYPPQLYVLVPPWNRLFLWPEDVGTAVGRLNLTPAPEMGAVM